MTEDCKTRRRLVKNLTRKIVFSKQNTVLQNNVLEAWKMKTLFQKQKFIFSRLMADYLFYFFRSVSMQVDKQHYTDKLRNYVLKLVSNMKTAITATIESELQRLLEDTIPYTDDSAWKRNRWPNNWYNSKKTSAVFVRRR